MALTPTTYNTGNAAPSNNAKDLDDNARFLDAIATDLTGSAVVDRLGKSRDSISKLESQYIISTINGGVWAAGIEITALNQYMSFNGIPYKAKSSQVLPYTTVNADATLDAGVEPFNLGLTDQQTEAKIKEITPTLTDLVFNSLADVNILKPSNGSSGDAVITIGAVLTIKDGVSNSKWVATDATTVNDDGIDTITLTVNPAVAIVRSKVKPTVSFIFDDGYTSAIDTVTPLFKSKGVTCGFAVSASLMDSSSASYATINQLLGAQSDGFEIINHGLDPTPIADTSKGTPFAESQINGNYDKLRQFGFNVQSYVAGNSVLAADYKLIVAERHSQAFTVDGSGSYGQAGVMTKPIDNYNLFRPSLFQLGVANAKATIDAAVKSNGWVCFYDHDPEQTYFPNSMSATDLEEVLDYAIAQGCDVVNPTLARQQLGDIEYNKSRVAITESNRNQGLAVVNTNLLRDPWYKTLTNSYAGWGDGGGNGDGTFTIANRKNGVFGNEVSLTVGSNGTISDGSYLLQSTAQRRESDFFPTSGNLTFSCEPYVTNSSFPDNFELTIGITQRKTTDNSVILTVESEVITVDTKARVQSVSIAPKDYSNASYFVVYYRLREKTTGVGATILIANPKLEVGSRPTAYADDAPLDINDYEFYEGIVDVAATSVPIGTFTKVALTDVNKNFWQIINNEFLCRDTGFYTFDLVVSSVSAGPYTDSRQLVEVYKNGVAEGKRESNTLSGSLLRWKWHGTKYLKAGDKLDWRLFQDFGGSIDVDTGTYSFLRVCKVG